MTNSTEKKWYAFVPNMLTLSNLICGVVALYFAFVNELQTSLILMLTGGLFDFFDGFIARLLKVSGELGKQLDSLADLITFGVLPSVMIFSVQRELILNATGGFQQFSILHWIFLASPVFISIFSALRLAKFNIDTRQSSSFIGVPTPANALFLASFSWTINYGNGTLSDWLANPLIVTIVIIIFSLLLVSNLPLFALKFKTFAWTGNEVRYIFLILSIILLTIFALPGLMMVILVYILLSAFHILINKTKTN